MPTYQYLCTDCGEPLEVVQAFSDDALTVCPACEGKLRKVYSAVGVVFKGSGFYRNDSRSGKSGETATPAAASSADSGSGASSSPSSSDSGSSPAPAATPAPTSTPSATPASTPSPSTAA